MGDDTVVVVGFAEALAAPEVAWSLVDAGFKVLAFARRGRRPALGRSRHVTIHEITPPEESWIESARDLSTFLASYSDDNDDQHVVLPLDDASVWLCAHYSLPSGWVLAGPRGTNAELALDKWKQIERARTAGFDVPESSVVSTTNELASYSSRLPLILRPVHAVSVHQTRNRKGANWICSDSVELQRATSVWRERGALLVQPYFQGIGEGVFGLATNDGVVAWSAHRRLRMMNPHGSGSSACISQAVPETVQQACELFLSSCGWRGLFMFELLREQNGRTWFVEFNGRAWGSMALARRQGLEYPAWAVQVALDRKITHDTFSAPVAMTCRNLGRDLMHLLFVARGPKTSAIKPWPSFWRSAREVLRFHRRDSFYNWRKDDWKVFFYDCWATIRNQLRKPVTSNHD